MIEQNQEDLQPRSPLSKKRKLQFSGLILGFLILLLGIGEIGSRIHYRGRFPSGMVPHAVRDHTHRPNWQGFEGAPKRGITVQHNNLGLREDTDLAKKFKEGKRVIVLGDSVAFGFRLPGKDTISVQLEGELDRGQAKWQTVNAGCYGYGVQDEAHWLEELEADIHADLVLLVLCYNDFCSLETKRTTVPSQFSQTLNSSSALAFSISRKWHQMQRWYELRGTRKLTRWEVHNQYLVKAGGENQAATAIFNHVVKVQKTVKKMNGRLAVVLWPGQLQFQEYLKTGKTPKEQTLFVALLKRSYPGIKVLVPYAEFKSYGTDEDLYMDHCHPSAKGVKRFTPRLAKLVKDSLH
jgi:lysophospholipase L1-like esterase